MYIANVTNDNITSDITKRYDNCTNNENQDIDTIFKFLLLSKPSSILLISLIS